MNGKSDAAFSLTLNQEGDLFMKLSVRDLVMTAVMAAVICVLGPLSIPIGPVPISLTMFAIFITLYVIGMKRGTIAVVIYLLIGLAGLPVFSGFEGGAAKIAGPTGGYLWGFIPMALISGAVIDRCAKKVWLCIIAMIAATAVLYILGTAWFVFSMKTTVSYALGVCVFPFIPVDLVKIVVSALLGPVLRDALTKAGVLRPAGA